MQNITERSFPHQCYLNIFFLLIPEKQTTNKQKNNPTNKTDNVIEQEAAIFILSHIIFLHWNPYRHESCSSDTLCTHQGDTVFINQAYSDHFRHCGKHSRHNMRWAMNLTIYPCLSLKKGGLFLLSKINLRTSLDHPTKIECQVYITVYKAHSSW